MLASSVSARASSSEKAEVEEALHDLMREMMLFHRGVARGLGLTLQQAMMLKVLGQEGPRQPSELAETFGITRPAVSVEVAVLERNGWVTRRAAPGNRRSRVVALTPRASRTLRSAMDASRQFFESGMASLSPSERREFARTLRTIVTHLHGQRGGDAAMPGGGR